MKPAQLICQKTSSKSRQQILRVIIQEYWNVHLEIKKSNKKTRNSINMHTQKQCRAEDK
jgi:hypothetical protein